MIILSTEQLMTVSLGNRFRGYLPVVIDIESGGFDFNRHALLEIAAVILKFDDNNCLQHSATYHEHVEVEVGMEIDDKALEFIGMDPYHPLRFAIPEKEALENIFEPVRAEIKKYGCQRAVLVGHNSWFDLSFINAAVARQKTVKNPFHQFTSIDTATLGAVFCGQTVLARIAEATNFKFDSRQAHSAKYDAEITAKIFCHFVNLYRQLNLVNEKNEPN